MLRWGGGEGGRSSLLFPPSPPPSSLQFPPLLPSSPPSSIEFSPAPFRSPPQFPSLLPNWGGSQEGTRENWGENKRELERTKGNSPQFSPVPPKVLPSSLPFPFPPSSPQFSPVPPCSSPQFPLVLPSPLLPPWRGSGPAATLPATGLALQPLGLMGWGYSVSLNTYDTFIVCSLNLQYCEFRQPCSDGTNCPGHLAHEDLQLVSSDWKHLS